MDHDSRTASRPRESGSVPRPRRGRARAPTTRVRGEPPIGVVHLTAEYWPLARTGGLGEAVHGLAAYQATLGQPTTVVLPLYRAVLQSAPDLERIGPPFTVRLGTRAEQMSLHRVPQGSGQPAVFLIEHSEFFDRGGIYGADGADYGDNAQRFAFFSLAALTALPRIAPQADILHAHDWHTALAPVYLRTQFLEDEYYRRLGTVLSVHNAGFQGHFPAATLGDLGLAPDLYTSDVFEWYGRMNVLKGGLAFADLAVTVSPTHALELRTPEGGFGLHDTFIGLGDRLVGILNGIDAVAWNPANDPAIPATYSLDELAGKRRCKTALQEAYALAPKAQTPIFAMSARLVAQKGLDIVLGADLASFRDAQFIFLGAGERRYERALADLAQGAPDRIATEFSFTDRLEHRLLAGADALLMPSLYEPCGLTQMRGQRYGTIPVARRVGGLADSIQDGVTGLLFDSYTPDAFAAAFQRAMALYADRPAWRGLVRNAMGLPFGWQGSAERYQDVYRRAAPR